MYRLIPITVGSIRLRLLSRISHSNERWLVGKDSGMKHPAQPPTHPSLPSEP